MSILLNIFLMFCATLYFWNYELWNSMEISFSIKFFLQYKSEDSLYSLPLAAVVDMGIMMIAFSAAARLLEINGFIHWFASKLTYGKRSGFGSALYTVLTSMLYGMLSSSARGNITQTSAYTMPLMRGSNYPPGFSIGLEAVASNVGQLTPPILGMTAYVIVEKTEILYSDIMLAMLIPGALIFVSLFIVVIVESIKLSQLIPTYKQLPYEILLEQHVKKSSAKMWISLALVTFSLLIFLIFFVGSSEPSEIGTGILISILFLVISSISLGVFFRSHSKTKSIDYFKFIIFIGKDSLYIILIAASIGVILFILESFNLLLFLTIASDYLTQNLKSLDNITIAKLVIVVISGLVTFYISRYFPTVLVFLLSSTLFVPIFISVGFAATHAYIFIFYYAAFSNVTPPFAPLIDQSIYRYGDSGLNKEQLQKDSEKAVWVFIFISMLLPIFWIFSPQIMLDKFNPFDITDDANLLYLLISFVLSIIALSIAFFDMQSKKGNLIKESKLVVFLDKNFKRIIKFSQKLPITSFMLKILNNNSIKDYHGFKVKWRVFLLFIGIITLLPFWVTKLAGTIMVLWFLILYDLKLSPSSILKPCYALLQKTISLRKRSFPFTLNLTVLFFVYIAYLSTSGFFNHFYQDSVSPWLNNRYHIALDLFDSNCDTQTVEKKVQTLLNPSDIDTILCVKTASISLHQTRTGSIFINDKIIAIEYDKNLKDLLLGSIEQSMREYYQKKKDGIIKTCFTDVDYQQIDINTKIANCRDDIFGLPFADLPLVFLGKELYENYNLQLAHIISLASSTLSQYQIDKHILEIEQKNLYMIGGVFETGFSGDIDQFVLLPPGSIDLFYDESSNAGIGYKLLIKMHDLDDIHQVAVAASQLRQHGFNFLYSIADTDKESTDSFQVTPDAFDSIFFIIGFVALAVLNITLMQILDKKRRMLALLRIDGIASKIVWGFLLMLSSIVAILPYLIAAPFIFFLELVLPLQIGADIFDFDFEIFISFFALILFFIFITTIFLKIHYFSRPIILELEDVPRK